MHEQPVLAEVAWTAHLVALPLRLVARVLTLARGAQGGAAADAGILSYPKEGRVWFVRLGAPLQLPRARIVRRRVRGERDRRDRRRRVEGEAERPGAHRQAAARMEEGELVAVEGVSGGVALEAIAPSVHARRVRGAAAAARGLHGARGLRRQQLDGSVLQRHVLGTIVAANLVVGNDAGAGSTDNVRCLICVHFNWLHGVL